MKNLAIILITLLPLIGFSQQIENERIYGKTKVNYESGIGPFSEISDKKQPTKVAATTTTAKTQQQQKNQIEKDNNDYATMWMYDNPKVYSKVSEELHFQKITRNQSTHVAVNITTTPVPQEFILPIYHEDDYKLGHLNLNVEEITPLKNIANDFIIIRVYENPKVYYEVKVPADSKNTTFTINHQHR